jgi:hypothetical protein
MAGWVLTDYGTTLPRPEGAVGPYDEYAETVIESEGQLLAELERLRRAGRPTFLSLSGPSEGALKIGLGPELSGLCWVFLGPWSRYEDKLALTPEVVADEEHGFADGGGGFVFEPRHLFPTDEAVEAAVYYYRTGQPPGWLEWEDL